MTDKIGPLVEVDEPKTRLWRRSTSEPKLLAHTRQECLCCAVGVIFLCHGYRWVVSQIILAKLSGKCVGVVAYLPADKSPRPTTHMIVFCSFPGSSMSAPVNAVPDIAGRNAVLRRALEPAHHQYPQA